ncbi:Holliday junction ATP-dependent DNA helicase RuvA [Candidatus Megaera venefica]|uniref:Holliday junction branch migration complex subunit RuvA n=2 Tax=Candidatus Megaera venefica TaxID=2055910 RepID=A0ABU5NEH4_9RICK|nr:Holliday junction ATP-dependent DNA helicase RuvA [Candidatus Megaera venefica]
MQLEYFMIGKLKGLIESVYDDHVIIDINGVGYLVFCSVKTLSQLAPSEFCELLIETHVREDHIHLYGFSDLEEKAAFITLQSVKGVGTRMALAILSHLTPGEIQVALNNEDKIIFNGVSGVGKKLAERIVTELKDKTISTKSLSEIAPKSGLPNTKTFNNSLALDAISALTSLGVGRIDAQSRVNTILAHSSDISINDLIRLALKN